MDEHLPLGPPWRRDGGAITIPLGTWIAKRDSIMGRYGHLIEHDMRLAPGGEDALVRRLQTLLFMARRAVIDLIRNA